MSLHVTIEPAVTADAGPLLVVQRSAYVSEAQWYDAPHIPPLVETLAEVVAAIAAGGVLVARLGDRQGRLVGSVRWDTVDRVCHIGRLSVATDLQGQGLGSRLLLAAEAAAEVAADAADVHPVHRRRQPAQHPAVRTARLRHDSHRAAGAMGVCAHDEGQTCWVGRTSTSLTAT